MNLLDEIEDGNAEHNPARGKQGEMGNFSNVVRRSVRQLVQLLLEQVQEAQRLGAPQECLDAMKATATMTLVIETFFTGQRTQYPNPYALQYAQSWASAVLLEAAQNGECPFSCWWRDLQRPGRAHYLDGSSAIASCTRFQLAKPKPKIMEAEQRQRRLCVLRELAAYFQQARQGRVTDKGKERVGTLPAPNYGPQAVVHPVGSAFVGFFDATAEEGATQCDEAGASATKADAPTEHVLCRANDVGYVRPVTGGIWVALFKAPLVVSTSVVDGVTHTSYNTDRLPCRYFVPTDELWSRGLEHAQHWWSKPEQSAALRLASREDALARAAQSSGVHFSFEKTDQVTASTICGTFAPGSIAE
jgi:hypothetical protein